MGDQLIHLWEDWKGSIQCHLSQKKWLPDELKLLSDRLIADFKKFGVCAGDLVGIALTNSVGFPVALLALLSSGCNPVLINPASATSEMEEIAEKYSLKYILHDFIAGISRLEINKFAPVHPIFMAKYSLVLLGTHSDRNTLPHCLNIKGVLLHPTSGTYGKSTYCLRTQENAAAEAKNYIESISIYNRITITLTTPLYHAFAFGFGLASALLSQSNLNLFPSFNPRTLLRNIKQDTGDILTLVPPVLPSLIQLAQESGRKMSPYVFYAGAHCNEVVITKFEEVFNTRLFQIYGTTESGAISTTFSAGKATKGVGRPLKNVKVVIDHNEKQLDAVEEIGEIKIKSTSMMDRYVSSPLTSALWATGDLGYKDEEGNLFLVGRKRDIINVNGSKVDPKEIEERLLKHSSVIDAAVYPGLSFEEREIVQAALVVKDKPIDVNALRKYCYEHLSENKVPRMFHVLETLPRSASGKCLKEKLPGYPENLKTYVQ